MSFQLPADAGSAARSLSAGSSSAASLPGATVASARNATRSSENASTAACHLYKCASPARHSKRRKPLKASVRGGSRRVCTSALKKIIKNAREKKRVRIVRILYEELSMVLRGKVERGSGHFSKVRALAAAIRRIEDLTEKMECLAKESEENGTPSSLQGLEMEVGSCTEIVADMSPLEDEKDLTGVGAEVNLNEINLSCEESLDPVPEKPENSQLAPLPHPPPLLPIPFQLQEEVSYSSLLPTTPYFSYNGSGVATSDFPPPLGCFTCPQNSTSSSGTSSTSSNLGLPPSSSSSSSSSSATSSLYSPELGTTPPPYSHHCGQDVWLAIGCN